MIILYCGQGGDEWHAGRRGVITMSNAKAMITSGSKGKKYGATRESYLLKVAAERLTNSTPDNYQSWSMARGTALEEYALMAYQAETGSEVTTIGLAYTDETRRISASPDGLVGVKNGGVEIKCPEKLQHIKTVLSGIPKENVPQIQGNMMVFEAKWWDFVSFNPEVAQCPIFICRVNRDDEIIKRISESCISGVEFIDDVVNQITNESPTYKNKAGIDCECKNANLMLETMFNNDNAEVEL